MYSGIPLPVTMLLPKYCTTIMETTGCYKIFLTIYQTTWFHISEDVNLLSVPHRKHRLSIIMTNQLMLFREIIAVYCENHKKHIKMAEGTKL
jgi:hypothetical protein